MKTIPLLVFPLERRFNLTNYTLYYGDLCEFPLYNHIKLFQLFFQCNWQLLELFLSPGRKENISFHYNSSKLTQFSSVSSTW